MHPPSKMHGIWSQISALKTDMMAIHDYDVNFLSEATRIIITPKAKAAFCYSIKFCEYPRDSWQT